jgi:hypothetical protein
MSDERALARTAASQHGLLTLAQQRAAGITPQTVRHRRSVGRYERFARGVDAIAGTPASWHQRVMAAWLAAGEDAGVSHRTGTQLWSIGTFPGIIEVAVRYERAPVIPGVRVHRSLDLERGDLVMLDGIRVTSVPRTIVDVGSVVPPTLVELLAERAIGRGLTTPAQLRAMLDRVAKRGRRGVGALRKVLDERALGDDLTDSEIEEIFARVCRDLGMPTPTPQVPVVAGGKAYRLDFAYVPQKVAIEVHGFTDHGRRKVWEYDHERRNLLLADGWRIPEFTRRQLLRDRPHIRRTLGALLCSGT